jgi:hypothetical protein
MNPNIARSDHTPKIFAPKPSLHRPFILLRSPPINRVDPILLYRDSKLGVEELATIAAEDIGRCAYGIFKGHGSYIGRTVGIAGAHLTGAQIAASLTNALGVEVSYNDVAPETYRAFGFPGAEDLGNMFQLTAISKQNVSAPVPSMVL